MALQSLFTGETAGTSAALNNNFDFLEQQIQNLQAILGITPGGVGAAGQGVSVGVSTVIGRGFQQAGSVAAALGNSQVRAFSTPVSSILSVGAATGADVDSYIAISQAASVAAATGGSSAASFSITPSAFAGTGSSTAAAVGSAGSRTAGLATGSSTAASTSIHSSNSVGATTGGSTAQATGSGTAAESPAGTTVVQPSQQIFASSVPGSASSTLNTFALTASPGTVVVNGANDTTQTTATELYYTAHTLYLQNTTNTWVRWVSAGNWSPVASPLPAPNPTESVEGLSVTTANTIMYTATRSDGQGAPAGATVGNGLDTWTMTANPGQLSRNNGTPVGGGVTQIYYHNHQMWQLGNGNWYIWTITGPVGGFTQAGTAGFPLTPFPSTPAINISTIPDTLLNNTFVVSGTYQGLSSGGASTNLIANSSNNGAGAGTPGILSTGWTSALNGLTQTVVGQGIDGVTGLPYIDWQISGTATSNACSIAFGNVSVSPGNAYTFSVSIALTAGTLTNIPYIGLNWNETNSGGGLVTIPAGGNASAANSTIAQYKMTSTTTSTTTTLTPFFAPTFVPTLVPGLGSFTVGGHLYQLDAAKNMLVDSLAVANGNNTATLVYSGGQIYAQDAGSNAWFIYSGGNFNGASAPSTAAGPVNATFRIAGVGLNTGLTPATFVATPVQSGVPTLNYQDNSTGSWLPFSSNANVTTTTWSFVHPAVATITSAFTVGVRDANQTGVAKLSNQFSIFAQGQITIGAITLNGLASGSSISITGNQPAGTVVGQLAVATAPGSFSGSIITTGVNAAKFTVNSSYQLVTAAVLGAGTLNIGLQATQNQAAGSPQTANFNVVVSAEAVNGFSVSSVGGTVVGSSTPGTAGSQLTWKLVTATSPATGLQFTLSVNGGTPVLQTFSNNVTQLYYVNHTLYQLISSGSWFVFNGTITNGVSSFSSSSSPIPVITLTNVEAGAGLTGDDGQVSVVGTGGVATDSFIPTPNAIQLFSIQMFVAGTALPYASGPSSYAITGGANASSFSVVNSGTGWFLNCTGGIPAGQYAVTLTATY